MIIRVYLDKDRNNLYWKNNNVIRVYFENERFYIYYTENHEEHCKIFCSKFNMTIMRDLGQGEQ